MNAATLNRILIVLGWAGVFVAGFLTVGHVFGRALPCGIAHGCDLVAAHPSSRWFGIPVAVFGLAGYLLLTILATARALSFEKSDMTVKFGLLISAFGTLMSMYLTYTAIFTIRATCIWCLSSALIMFLTFITYAALSTKNEHVGAKKDLVLSAVFGVLALGGIGVGFGFLGPGRKMTIDTPVAALGLKPSDIVSDEKYFVGPKDAKITVLEFADFYCAACRQEWPNVQLFLKTYGSKVRFAFVNFPVYQHPGHERSIAAAKITHVAMLHGRYYEVVEKLFETPIEDMNTDEKFYAAMAKVGVDPVEYKKIFNEKAIVDPLTKGFTAAEEHGVDSTPTFIIFTDKGEPKFLNGGLLDAMNESPYRELLQGSHAN